MAAFFLLLRIMTTLRKEPTTAQPRRMRTMGMRTAQTRGGKKFWSGWLESTKGLGSWSVKWGGKRRGETGEGGGGQGTMRRVQME